MTKAEAIERLNVIMEKSKNDTYNYEVVVKDWENYGKSRTYFSIIETKERTKHHLTKKYGYYDNISDEYVPDIRNDLRDDYNFNDRKF